MPGEQLDLLDVLARDGLSNEWEWTRFCRALHACASGDGIVSQNDVRAALSNEYGLTIEPHRYSAFWLRAQREGVLRWDRKDALCWDVNTDRASGNAGKPQRRYRLVEQ